MRNAGDAGLATRPPPPFAVAVPPCPFPFFPRAGWGVAEGDSELECWEPFRCSVSSCTSSTGTPRAGSGRALCQPPPAAASQPCDRAGHIQPERAAGTRAGTASCPSAGQDLALAIPWVLPMWGWGSQGPGPVLPAHGSFSPVSHVQGPDMSSQEIPQARRFPIEAGDCPSLAAAPEAQEPVGAEQPAGR